MLRLYQAQDRIEAQILLDLLASRRIPAVVLGDFLSGAAGELPADITPTLWITDERDLDLARHLIDEFRHPAASPEDGPWDCPACGERLEAGFGLCWNCGRARP